MNPLPPEQTPVIVGVGQIRDKTKDLAKALEPLALMAAALRAAEADAAAGMLGKVDSLDIVAEHSWPYVDAPALLAETLGIHPARAVYGQTGGESPVRFIHEAALRIVRGETRVAAVVGAESAYSVVAAMKAGDRLSSWAPRDPKARLVTGRDLVNPIAYRNGVDMPVQVYPFYENATLQHWGQTPADALAETGSIWSEFSRAAAANPYAWSGKALTSGEVTTPTDDNRLIAWPYTKYTVANPMVNQGAAVLLASLAEARAAGVAEDRLVYVWGGAAAAEPRDYLQRDQYVQSHAQNAVLSAVLDMAGGAADAFAFLELYSCFPCVPKMARRTLRLADGIPMSVTGGLSFFGAPLNNYMTHAAASLVGALRGRPGALALLYGQGEYVTKHHAVVLASKPPATDTLSASYDVTALADAQRGAVPTLVEEYTGPATIETFTVVYKREGIPAFGTVIARTPSGQRLMARVPTEDTVTLDVLTDLQQGPIGRQGSVRPLGKDLLGWSLAA